MNYNQTNIKNNIIYFPLWRIKILRYEPWSWEERYDITLTDKYLWPHNCIHLGAIALSSEFNYCPNCGANKLNEPSHDAINDYMDAEYE